MSLTPMEKDATLKTQAVCSQNVEQIHLSPIISDQIYKLPNLKIWNNCMIAPTIS